METRRTISGYFLLSSGAITTTRYVYNGANQIQYVDADASGICDGSKFVWVHDDYGNLLNDGTITYTYDAALRLTSVTTGGTTTSYTYNGNGDRVSQTVGAETTTYICQQR